MPSPVFNARPKGLSVWKFFFKSVAISFKVDLPREEWGTLSMCCCA